MNKFLERIWYSKRISFEGIISLILYPISILYYSIIKIKNILFSLGVLYTFKSNKIVIVVGNVTVGGSGKTPFCILLTKILEESQMKVGIIASGYKSSVSSPIQVTNNSLASEVGDEAKELAAKTSAIVISSNDRVQSALYLENNYDVDVVIHDDGLQNNKIDRDFEFLLINNISKFGNGFLLPAGPLREPSIFRIKKSDITVYTNCNTKDFDNYNLTKKSAIMIKNNTAHNLTTGENKTISSFNDIHLVCGISNTKSVERNLISNNIKYSLHKYNDHYNYSGVEILFDDNKPVFVTMKDYVKLEKYKNNNLWILDYELIINSWLEDNIKDIINKIKKK